MTESTDTSSNSLSLAASACAVVLLVLLAGMANGVMDTLQFHFAKSAFARQSDRAFWDPSVSWRNKYRAGEPALGDAFPLSSSALVFLTDGWHLSKFVMLNSLMLAIVAYRPLMNWRGNAQLLVHAGAFAVVRAAFAVGFSLTYV